MTLADAPPMNDHARIVSALLSRGVDADVYGQFAAPTRSAEAGVVPVRVGPGSVVIGPVRDETLPPGCSTCLHTRSVALRHPEEQAAVAAGVSAPSGADGQLADAALAQIAILAASLRPGDGRIVELQTRSLTVRGVDMLPHSDCPVCSTPIEDSPDLVYATGHVAKRADTDYRGRDLEQFAMRPDALVNDVAGVIGSQRFTVYECTATLPVSGFFRVRSRFAYHEMWWSGQLRSRTKSTLAGMLEGLERYAGQYPRSRTTVVHGSRRELGIAAIDPRRLGEYSDAFHAKHAESYVRFDDELEMPWVWGYSFAHDAPVLVPEQIAYYLDRSDAPKFVQECSSGCATGSTADEAVLHGLLELIERDSFLLNWAAGTSMPEIAVDDADAPDVRFVLDRLARIGYRVRFFDLRVDLPVPSVLAVAERLDGGVGRLCFAAGAAFEPIEAIRSALAEVASYVPGLDERTTSRADELHAMVSDWSRVTELTHHALLYGLPEMRGHASFVLDSGNPATPIDDLYEDWLRIRPRTGDLADDVRFLVDLVAGIGGDVVVVDQTTPEQRRIDVATVAVISDGLIPIDFGWERQRVHGHRRLRAYLEGRLDDRAPDARGAESPRQPNNAPHPFP